MEASLSSIDTLFEWTRFPAAAGPTDVLIEVPHGATEAAHFDELHDRLTGPLPADLKAFFFVNTDVGAPECAFTIAGKLAAAGFAVGILRCLIPRTFVDTNRLLETTGDGEVVDGLTPGLPGYITDPGDARILTERHRRYQDAADTAFAAVCGAGGLGLILHTYAPVSVSIDRVDGDIVARLRDAYRAEALSRWPRRPPVDVISRDDRDRLLAPAELVGEVLSRYRACGIDATENATYRLHPSTAGYRHARRHRGRVLCVELNRERLGAPWTPFEPFVCDRDGVESLSTPIVDATGAWLRSRR